MLNAIVFKHSSVCFESENVHTTQQNMQKAIHQISRISNYSLYMYVYMKCNPASIEFPVVLMILLAGTSIMYTEDTLVKK